MFTNTLQFGLVIMCVFLVCVRICTRPRDCLTPQDKNMNNRPANLKGNMQKDPFTNALSYYPFEPMRNAEVQIFEDILQNKRIKIGFGDAGRSTLTKYIQCLELQQDSIVVMEVGVWFGESIVLWLQSSPRVKVIGVDPFIVGPKGAQLDPPTHWTSALFGIPWFNQRLTSYNIQRQFQDAISRTLIIPGFYPNAIKPLLKLNPKPNIDIFYLDGGKLSDSPSGKQIIEYKTFVTNGVELILNNFPHALISGDDWNHQSNKPHFQDAIKMLAKKHNRMIFVSQKRTWFLVHSQNVCFNTFNLKHTHIRQT